MKKFNVIIATDQTGGFGLDGELPWDLEKDYGFFKSVTRTHSILPGINLSDNILIAGRKTWESMERKPLPGRITWVVTSQWEELAKTYASDKIKFFPTFFSAYQSAQTQTCSDIWVIGGKSIYDAALRHWACGQVYWTKVCGTFKTDVSIDMTSYSIEWTNKITSNDIDLNTGILYLLEFNQGYVKTNIESQYLETMYDVITTGESRQTRNAVTFSKFNKTLSCDLSRGFPLLTTKKMFWKGIVEELLFFIRGETDTTKLSAQGVKIWELNTSQEFLNSVGLPYKPGCMGPMYGYQWRHWGKPFVSADKTDEVNTLPNGIDQLTGVIEEIKSNPHSRRILMTDFNPSQASQGVLYPCHSIVMQFYVDNDKLSCMMYQRSGDVFLGIPFNIASTSLLTHIIAKLTGLKPGHVHIVLGDYHIYDTHIAQVYEQLERVPMDFAQLVMPDFTDLSQVENAKFEDFQLVGYQSGPAIKAQMVA